MPNVFEGIDFRRVPYRGILSEVAAEEGVTRDAIRLRLQKEDPGTVEKVAERIKACVAARKQSLRRSRRVVAAVKESQL